MTARRARGILAILLLVWVLALPSVGASAEHGTPPLPLPVREASPMHQVADVVLARPLSAVRLVVGAALLPLAWPVAAVLGDADWAVDVCIRDPANHLLHRPLGEL